MLDIRSLTSNKCIAQDAEALLPAVAPPGPSWRLGTSGGCRVAGPQKSVCFPSGVIFHGTTPQPSSTNGSIHQGSKAAPPNKNQKYCGWCYCSDPSAIYIHMQQEGIPDNSMSGVSLLSLGYAPKCCKVSLVEADGLPEGCLLSIRSGLKDA